jgi:MATE family multidrug resistance protein
MTTFRHELRQMLTLAWPVVLAEVGWISMGIVDTVMVGPLGPEAIGAVGIGSSVFLALAVFGMGLLLGLDTLVSQSFGAGRHDRCHYWLVQGVYLVLILSVPLTALSLGSVAALPIIGIHGRVLELTTPYFVNVTWSLVPLLLYACFRRYLQGMHVVRPITFVLITANLINLIGNWILVYGHLGAPKLGVEGAAWATVGSRVYMAATLMIVILIRERDDLPRGSTVGPHEGGRSTTEPARTAGLHDVAWTLSPRGIAELVRLGFPAASQIALEVAVFAAATALAGRLDPASLAAHQIALNIAAFAFMVPLGLASAGAVRVGHAVGRGDPPGARRAGWTALLLGVSFMSAAALAFLLVPIWLIGLFTTDVAVIVTGTSLLRIAALFQVFDGVQVVATGILRGVGNTRTPMLTNLAGHWVIGLPLGYSLCFFFGWGVQGLWIGLSAGLMIVGTVLVRTWWRYRP